MIEHILNRPAIKNEDKTHDILLEMANYIDAGNVRMLKIGLKKMMRILDCPNQRVSHEISKLDKICNLIHKMNDLFKGVELNHAKGPEIEFRFAGAKVMRWKLMKKLGLEDEAKYEISKEEIIAEERKYLKGDEHRLDKKARQNIVSVRRFEDSYYYKEILPDINRSREMPGCRKYAEKFLAARDEFVKELNNIYDHYFSRDATDFHCQLNYVERVEQLLLDFKAVAPYENIYEIICEDASKLRKVLPYGIILLESDYDAEAEIKSVLHDVRLHIHLMNHGLGQLEFYLEDDFLEPDSEKCAEYYYQEYVVEREKQRRDLQFDLDFYGDEFDNRPPF